MPRFNHRTPSTHSAHIISPSLEQWPASPFLVTPQANEFPSPRPMGSEHTRIPHLTHWEACPSVKKVLLLCSREVSQRNWTPRRERKLMNVITFMGTSALTLGSSPSVTGYPPTCAPREREEQPETPTQLWTPGEGRDVPPEISTSCPGPASAPPMNAERISPHASAPHHHPPRLPQNGGHTLRRCSSPCPHWLIQNSWPMRRALIGQCPEASLPGGETKQREIQALSL